MIEYNNFVCYKLYLIVLGKDLMKYIVVLCVYMGDNLSFRFFLKKKIFNGIYYIIDWEVLLLKIFF